jgi:hypothetical protein
MSGFGFAGKCSLEILLGLQGIKQAATLIFG